MAQLSRRWVEFDIGLTSGVAQRGYENAKYPGPIDKAADMVLASTRNKIQSLVVVFDSGPMAFIVLRTSEEFWAELEAGNATQA